MIDKHDWRRICYLRLDLQGKYRHVQHYMHQNPKSASKMLAMFDLLLFFQWQFLLRQGEWICWPRANKKSWKTSNTLSKIMHLSRGTTSISIFQNYKDISLYIYTYGMYIYIYIYIPQKSGVNVSWPPFFFQKWAATSKTPKPWKINLKPKNDSLEKEFQLSET